MIKIKEYPPVIDIKTIIEDRLVGAKSSTTVIKRLQELKVEIFQYEMVKTEELFKALLPSKEEKAAGIKRVQRVNNFKIE